MSIQEAVRRKATGQVGTHCPIQRAVDEAFAARSASLSLRESDRLLEAASSALKRLQDRKNEDPEEWARRLAPTFFADLDQKPFLKAHSRRFNQNP